MSSFEFAPLNDETNKPLFEEVIRDQYTLDRSFDHQSTSVDEANIRSDLAQTDDIKRILCQDDTVDEDMIASRIGRRLRKSRIKLMTGS